VYDSNGVEMDTECPRCPKNENFRTGFLVTPPVVSGLLWRCHQSGVLLILAKTSFLNKIEPSRKTSGYAPASMVERNV